MLPRGYLCGVRYLNGIGDRLPEEVQPHLSPDATGVGWVMQYVLLDRSDLTHRAIDMNDDSRRPQSGHRRPTMMTQGQQKLTLTAHVTSSVGWLGAVAAFLALAVTGLASPDDPVVRAAYLAMQVVAWSVIVPLSLVSPITGVVQSLGTSWGLVRHYWVLAKFLITIPATVILLVHLQPIERLARAAAAASELGGNVAGLRIQLVVNAAAALVILLVATALSIYKPRGLTPFGPRASPPSATPAWTRWSAILVGLLIAAFLVLHLAGRGLGNH